MRTSFHIWIGHNPRRSVIHVVLLPVQVNMADTSESHDGTARPALSWATFFPFTSSALASLPSAQRPVRYTRQDDIPETDQEPDGQRPTVRDYHAINSVPPQMRIPKKLATSLKVEAKVWFANERSEHDPFCLFSPSDRLPV